MLNRPLPAPKPLLEVIDGAFSQWLGDGDFSRWRAFCAALTAAPMSEEEFALYRQCTGRTTAPQKPFTEAYAIVGRRGGKSRIAAALAVYAACHVQWPRTPGETLRVMVVAVNKEQAGIVLGYVEALLRSRPALERLIRSVGAESIELVSGIQITCVANNYRSIRGSTVVCAIFEELAYWYDETSANPDKEVYRAVRPAMLTVPGALLVGISSPRAKRGLLFEKHRAHHGRDDSPILVWQAPTATMNPRVNLDDIAEAYVEDSIGASAEYGAQFRDDIAAYVLRERVEACVEVGCCERPPVAGVSYVAFCDPAGGGGGDSMTLGIAHRERDSKGREFERARLPARGQVALRAVVGVRGVRRRAEVLPRLSRDGRPLRRPLADRAVRQVRDHLRAERAPEVSDILGQHSADQLAPRLAARRPEVDQPAVRAGAPHRARRQGLDRPSAQRTRRRGERGPGRDRALRHLLVQIQRGTPDRDGRRATAVATRGHGRDDPADAVHAANRKTMVTTEGERP